MPSNLQVELAKRPAPRLITPDCFSLEEAPASEPGPGEISVRVHEGVRTGGLGAFVDTLNLLYTGGNNCKLVLKV